MKNSEIDKIKDINIWLNYELTVEKERNYINMKLLNSKSSEIADKTSMINRLNDNFHELLSENRLLEEHRKETEILINKLSKENFMLQAEMNTYKFTPEAGDVDSSITETNLKSPKLK